MNKFILAFILLLPSISFAQQQLIQGVKTFYFAPNGTDNFQCEINNPCLKMQPVYDHIRNNFRMVNALVIFKLADGIYDGNSLQVAGFIPGQPSPGQFLILGNKTNPENVVIRPTGTNPSFTAAYGGMFHLEGVKMDHTNTKQDMIQVGQFSSVRISNVDFGYNFNPYNHITLSLHAYLEVVGSYRITGGGQCHILMGNQSNIYYNTNGVRNLIDVFIENNPDFYSGFIYLTSNASANIQAIGWKGRATGRKFVVEGNSSLDIGGTHPCDLPGDKPGLLRTNGQLLAHPGDFVPSE